MVRVRAITSFDAPELAPYRTLRQSEAHRAQGLFVAEGEKVVRRLVSSRCRVRSLLLPPKWLEEYQRLLESRADWVDIYVAEKAVLEQLTGFSMYQGLLALACVPEMPGLDTLLEQSPPPRLWVAVDGLSNAENLGGIVRSCAALGVQALIAGETCASPYLRRAVRASMGTVFDLAVLETTDLIRLLQSMPNWGMHRVAAHPRPGSRSLFEADLVGDCCLVLGSEGEGLRPGVVEACDEVVRIPMVPGVDSLNVGGAAAVLLYETLRQRHSRRDGGRFPVL